jgi:hypothetical protein
LVDGEDDSDENNKDRWAALLIDADNRVICRRISIAGSRPASGREGSDGDVREMADGYGADGSESIRLNYKRKCF